MGCEVSWGARSEGSHRADRVLELQVLRVSPLAPRPVVACFCKVHAKVIVQVTRPVLFSPRKKSLLKPRIWATSPMRR